MLTSYSEKENSLVTFLCAECSLAKLAFVTARVTLPSHFRAGGCGRASPSLAGSALLTGLSADSSRGGRVTAADGLGRREGPSRPPSGDVLVRARVSATSHPDLPPAASCCSPTRELGQWCLVPCRSAPTPTPTPTRDLTASASAQSQGAAPAQGPLGTKRAPSTP